MHHTQRQRLGLESRDGLNLSCLNGATDQLETTEVSSQPPSGFGPSSFYASIDKWCEEVRRSGSGGGCGNALEWISKDLSPGTSAFIQPAGVGSLWSFHLSGVSGQQQMTGPGYRSLCKSSLVPYWSKTQQ